MRLRIKDIVTVRNEKTTRNNNYIGLENIISWDAKFLQTDIESEGTNCVFHKGDILFGKLRPYLAKGYIPEYSGTCSTEFLVMIAKKSCSNKFLLYAFLSHSIIDYIKNQVAGVKMPRTNWNAFSSIELDIPTLSEQRRMVDYLDTKLSEIDRQVSLLTRKRDAYLRLKKSIINHAVTKGLDKNAKMKDSGIEWIGKVPEQWEVKRLKDCVTLTKGRTPNDLTLDPVNLPYLTMDYLRDREGKDIMYPKQTAGLLKIGANEIIVLWDGANAGEFILSKEGYLGSTMALVECKRNAIVKDYLYYLLKGIEFDSKYYANGTTIPHFDSITIMTRQYPLPPTAEQRSIATYLDDKCGKIDTIVANLNKQINCYADLKRSLIDEVITGKRAV